MTGGFRLEPLQLDILREIGNIGAGHAATSLSKILGMRIEMSVPNVEILSFDKIAQYVGEDKLVVGIYMSVEGDMTGSIFFLMGITSAKFLLSQLFQEELNEKEPFTEKDLDALQEIGNILTGSYLSALADFTHLTLYPSIPSIAVDMAMAILTYGILEIGRSGNDALLIDTSFMNGSEKLEGHFFFIPDPSFFPTLFKALGVPM
ncbi:chemotaxis protein CheC [Thermicanus aegyptius]|uniref:chemotaxis protein CheC n=1 Tax=Thermicanus aegyptius TaxID=94009 RepID=UPI00034DC33E|nr:chemotaxis protein CheC [Thermicanus aegyptius]